MVGFLKTTRKGKTKINVIMEKLFLDSSVLMNKIRKGNFLAMFSKKKILKIFQDNSSLPNLFSGLNRFLGQSS